MRYIFSRPLIYAYTFFIFYLSVIPVYGPPGLPYIDKIVHLLWYTLLSFLVLNAVLLRKENYAMLKAFSYAFSVGFVIEAIQLFIPYRSFEFADIIFNSLGAAVGILVKII